MRTKETFQKRVAQNMENGLSFVLATYQALDEFVAREIEESGVVLACREGCSNCCLQLISCTEMEADEVVGFIRSMPRTARHPLEVKVKKHAIEWGRYYQKNERRLRINPFISFQDWLGQPCVFLNQRGTCDIYPVRIMDCRTVTSLVPCTEASASARIPCPLHHQGPGRFRFQSETWANNMILDEQLRRARTMSVTPILHWLLVKMPPERRRKKVRVKQSRRKRKKARVKQSRRRR